MSEAVKAIGLGALYAAGFLAAFCLLALASGWAEDRWPFLKNPMPWPLQVVSAVLWLYLIGRAAMAS